MRWDFWNNPIIVSAFRVKYRRTPPTLVASMYLLLLIGLGTIMYQYGGNSANFAIPWHVVYLTTVISIQLAISTIIAATTTQASINSEVLNRTLDFQRIASISPREILFGKLMGEPALAYLLIAASIPATFTCVTLGSIDVLSLVFIYINLLTSTILMGSLGLQHSLETPSGKKTGTGGSPILGWMIGFFVFAPQVLFNLPFFNKSQVGKSLIGLTTPLLTILGVYQRNVWSATIELFGTYLPLLIVTPICQLVIGAIMFEIMVRRMINPIDTALEKWQALLLLFFWDLLIAGLAYRQFDPGEFTEGITTYLVLHFVAATVLVVAATPRRETLLSWIWRVRRPGMPLRERYFGGRTESGPTLLVACLLGLISLALFFVLPEIALHGSEILSPTALETTVPRLLLAIVVTLLFCTLYQWLMLIFGRSGKLMALLLFLFIVSAPMIVGVIYESREMEALSPIAFFVFRSTDPKSGHSPIPVFIVYLGLVGIVRFLLQRQMSYYVSLVDAKIKLLLAPKQTDERNAMSPG